MKRLLSLAIISLASIAIADPLYVPRTSEENNRINVMGESQLAYIPNDDGTTARLMVGNGTTSPLAIMDPAVLRGTATREVPANEINYEFSNTITLSDGIFKIENRLPIPSATEPTTDKNNIEGKITITVDDRTIAKVTLQHNGDDLAGRFGNPGDPTLKLEYSGNKAIINWTQIPMSIGRVWGIKVYYCPKYMDYVNDTTDIDYKIKDTMGIYNLSQFREYCINYWKLARQLATNWCEYAAYKDVKLNGNIVRWDRPTSTIYNTTFDNYSEDLVTYGKGIPLMTLRAHGGESTASGSLNITAVSPNNNEGTYELTYSESITGFSKDKLELWTTDYLEADKVNWILEKPISHTYSNHTGTMVCNMNTRGGNRKFYKLVYDSIASGVYQVIFEGQVIIKDQLILRSITGNTFWRIKVDDNGTLSTERVTDNMPE